MDKLTLSAHLMCGVGAFRACVDVPDIYMKQFAPLALCDEPSFAAIGGVTLADSREAEIVLVCRKGVAEILAKEIAEFIVKAMAQNDTLDGYPVSGAGS